ncbi:hypothetical protein O6H91_22G025400 [Diphasiastrum complanatum]|uniref:Uncharacterized protein n=7 Tax=Diphasiastrum complanatum TaxID=34168 RepID=A0ACC2ADX8_DIPCM|nr:hypothetical protein O6H91_22G025400 [Diphasiastrum complanatum]KAJ7515732.1 hypothetical protein O6H91_22G025400 [Diphasiastrum complanatum]KAJ7515733.1 hypothetical protein O6H91_22G025400 [Diphasiastrum complanatum]KAJ7515734.1 hypothetical protein O6H91_22G025400 [Diphasiastrum complanatum]KAJ7515735.1 hypothetical protein O6H91_22G025400 [Diphasiastrum complanatum]
MGSSVMESFFQRSLDDLVKGLRVQVIGEARYVAKALEETRKEIKSTDLHTKAVAVQKLTYLHMLQGLDISWAAFHVVEVMSSSKFCFKKIGYLAASQSFHEGTEVLLLITNLLRKDLGSKNEYEAGLALDCLSRIATPDLARDLTPEVFTMLTSSRLYVRKKATLVLLKVFSKYPDAIRIAFKRLVEKLEDSDTQVVGAAVTVLCELAISDPKPYLPLAPEFYRLLANSSNNWLSIKLVKIFGVLCPVEPRLARKIAEPICEQMRKTGAKSLVFECIRTVTLGLSEHAGAVELAVEKLKEFMAEEDPNLRYLGLQSLSPLMSSHPWALTENKLLIVRCLKDADPSIQVESLRLITGMVSEDNVIETVEILLQYARSSEPVFCNELISAILSTCSKGIYDLITDFTWYVQVLGAIARLPNCEHEAEVERQLVDIGLRVKSVRGDLLKVCRELLMDPALLDHAHLHKALSAAAWVVGEFAEVAHDPFQLIEALLQPRTKLLPASVHAVYLQSVLKIFVFSTHTWVRGFVSTGDQGGTAVVEEEFEKNSREGVKDQEENLSGSAGISSPVFHDLNPNSEERIDNRQHKKPMVEDKEGTCAESNVHLATRISSRLILEMMELIRVNVSPLLNSVEMEVQERASNLLGLLKKVQEILGVRNDKLHEPMDIHTMEQHSSTAANVLAGIQSIFSVEPGPVSLLAQSKVTVPKGLDLVSSLDELGHPSYVDDDPGTEKDWEDGRFFLKKSRDGSISGETSSLLALHREKHVTFYLPNQAYFGDSNDLSQPLQEDAPMLSDRLADSLMLAEPKPQGSKPPQAKARPVVIRLEDEQEPFDHPSKSRKGLKVDILSTTIREVLMENKTKSWATSNRRDARASTSKHHRRSHRSAKSKKHERNEHGDVVQALDETIMSRDAIEDDVNSPQIGKAEKRSDASSRRHSKHSKNHAQLTRENREGMRYSRQRARSPLNIQPEVAIIPDFLL